MKRSKFTDEPILPIVREGEAGRKLAVLATLFVRVSWIGAARLRRLCMANSKICQHLLRGSRSC